MTRALVIACVLLAVTAGTASAAAPRIVIVSGDALPRQVVISDWERIALLVQQVNAHGHALARAQVRARPKLAFSMFWGPSWNDFIAAGNSPTTLRPAQADQQGSFYPAWHGRRAAIDLPWVGPWPRIVPAKALAILERYGVPT
jgi:hypothetical protein